MARGTLDIEPEKDLGDILGGLHFGHLRGIHRAAPGNALDKAIGARHRIDQLTDELVVGFVFRQRFLQPAGNLFPAPAVILARVTVAEAVAPKGDPVLAVVLFVGQQLGHQTGALIGSFVRAKSFEFDRGWQQPNGVEEDTTHENRIADGGVRLNMVLLVIPRQQAVDGVGLRTRRKVNLAGRQRGIAKLREGESLLPLDALVDPGPQDGDLVQL